MAEPVPVTISKVTQLDLSELLPLMRAYCDFYEVEPRDDRLVALCRALIDDPGEGVQYIARGEDNVAVGFATVYWTWQTLDAGRVGVMNDLYVSADVRGGGVGRALIEACRGACRKRGAGRARLGDGARQRHGPAPLRLDRRRVGHLDDLRDRRLVGRPGSPGLRRYPRRPHDPPLHIPAADAQGPSRRRRGAQPQADGARRPDPPDRRRASGPACRPGLRVIQKVEAIIREEMDAIGGHEVLLPVIQPAELWKRTGRYEIDELFKLKDRKGAEMVLAMTAEEALTFHVANEVRSYRELPLILYQIQTKERDEPRPRAGVLRTREFTMKDAYSFDRDEAGLDESYEKHRVAYERIYDRCGLRWYEVDSDVGMMGGIGAHEYMAPCEAGENDVALAPGYAANVEVASAVPSRSSCRRRSTRRARRRRPARRPSTTSPARSACPQGALIKAMPVVVEDDRGLVMVLVRGDHRLNEIKLANHLGARLPARPRGGDRRARSGPVGFIGPVGLEGVSVIKDEAIGGAGLVCGANEPDAHLIGVEPGRDFEFERGRRAPGRGGRHDRRRRDRSRSCPRSRSATSSSSAPATRSRSGPPTSIPTARSSRSSWAATGSARRGSSPPRSSSAPTSRASSGRRRSRPGRSTSSRSARAATRSRRPPTSSTTSCSDAGIETVLDDRANAGTGEKLTDAELLGCPLRLTIGKRGLADGIAEAQVRGGRRRGPRRRSTDAAAAVEPRSSRSWSSEARRVRERATRAASG